MDIIFNFSLITFKLFWQKNFKDNKWCTRLPAVSNKVYQLLAHGRWFSLVTPPSSTTKTGRHDIPGIWNIAESGIKTPKIITHTLKSIIILWVFFIDRIMGMYINFNIAYFVTVWSIPITGSYVETQFKGCPEQPLR